MKTSRQFCRAAREALAKKLPDEKFRIRFVRSESALTLHKVVATSKQYRIDVFLNDRAEVSHFGG